jgi:uncharacterized protein with PIN domain
MGGREREGTRPVPGEGRAPGGDARERQAGAGCDPAASTPRFAVDAMLGRLARWLRAMGYDTVYSGPSPGHAGDRRLLAVAHAEDRILVTRDRALARLAHPRGCLIRSEPLEDQLIEAVERLGLAPDPREWLSRCLECNGPLEPRARGEVAGLVPGHVLATREAFAACPTCARIYWAGTHADRMLERLARLLDRPSPGD